MPNETICLESTAFFRLLDEVVKRIDERFNLSEKQPWVGTDEALEILQIKSKTTLMQLRAEGKIRYSQPQHKVILYYRESLYQYLEKHAQNTF